MNAVRVRLLPEEHHLGCFSFLVDTPPALMLETLKPVVLRTMLRLWHQFPESVDPADTAECEYFYIGCPQERYQGRSRLQGHLSTQASADRSSTSLPTRCEPPSQHLLLDRSEHRRSERPLTLPREIPPASPAGLKGRQLHVPHHLSRSLLSMKAGTLLFNARMEA